MTGAIPLPDPMKATSGSLPHDDDGWAYEIKWDGMRVVSAVDGLAGTALMRSSNRIDVTVRFPELAGLHEAVAGRRIALDGEVVAFDADHRSSFSRLQQRMHVSDPGEAARRARSVPVIYVVFDLLHLDGTDTMPLPYEERRRILCETIEPHPSWQAPNHHTGDGQAMLDAATSQGLEGLIAKRVDSPYVPGRRSPAWRKVKVRRRQEVVVVGWTAGGGNRSGSLGSLLVAVHDEDADGRPLVYAGRVGTGFTEAELDRVGTLLAPLAVDRCPLDVSVPRDISRTARWVRPELVAEVEFGEWTPDGRLRHPSYLGLRVDKRPGDVIREPG